MLKSGKLLSELAPTYIYASTLIKCFTFKAKIYKTFSKKYMETILPPMWIYKIGYINYRMGKILFTQNSFEITCVDME